VSDIPASTVFVAPMRLARFFRDAGQALATVKPGPPTPEEIQRFLELTNAYGIGSAARPITPQSARRYADRERPIKPAITA
jgi:hypothetical protein